MAVNPKRVLKAIVAFVEQSLNSEGARERIAKGVSAGSIDPNDLRQAAAAASAAERAADVLFLVCRQWGYDPAPLANYLAHPDDQTRGEALKLSRQLQSWAESEIRNDENASGDVAPSGYLSFREIAKQIGTPQKALAVRRKLLRLMDAHKIPDGGFAEVANKRSHQPKIYFKLDAVAHLLKQDRRRRQR